MKTMKEVMKERNKKIKLSDRQDEIKRCVDLRTSCESCVNNRANHGDYFTCGATMCYKTNYPCLACSFTKWLNSGMFEDEIKAPPFPCDYYEEMND